MKLKSKIKFILIFAFMFIILGITKTFAASISVTPSTTSVAPGGTFTVTIGASDATGRVNISASNGTVNPTSVWIENDSKSVTVTAGSSGTVTVSVSGEVSNNSGVDKKISGSTSVKIGTNTSGGTTSGGNSGGTSSNPGTQNPAGNSNQGSQVTGTDTNVNLVNLGIRPNDFTGFKSSQTSYSVNVPNEVASVNVYATPASSNARVSGTGQKTLKEGTNRFDITVTNGGATKIYTISVIRKTIDGEIPPNVIDQENPDGESGNSEENVGIGLESLEIDGFELDQEFKTDVYEYKVITDKVLTLEELELIKPKILAKANSENVVLEVVPEITEDGKSIITIIVKDAEKEYARYIITFGPEEKEDENIVAGIVTDNSNNDGKGSWLSNIPTEYKLYTALAGIGLIFLIGISYTVIAYLKSKQLQEYEEDFSFEDNNELANAQNYYNIDKTEKAEEKERIKELETNDVSVADTAKDILSKAEKLGGYRSLRSHRKSSGGRHF